jgi:hypothetical protein
MKLRWEKTKQGGREDREMSSGEKEVRLRMKMERRRRASLKGI